MAVIKHIAVKNSNYDAALDYLTTQHDELTGRPILDEQGHPILRENYLIDGILCDPYTYGWECVGANYHFQKNQKREDIKAHHYIISFDPRDRTENGLTMEKAQQMGMDFARKNFPRSPDLLGTQTLVCIHPDGHNGTGNIHVHIVINSLRIRDVERAPFIERKSDCLAGMKHRASNKFIEYLKQETMDMCQQAGLYQVDLLSPAKVRVTDREYWAQRRGQINLDKANSEAAGQESKPQKTKFETEKEILRNAVTASVKNSHSIEELKDRLLSDYGIYLFESRGRFSFQIPGRTKAIRARQLGTDFEKESIQKYFDETKGRVEMPVLNSDATAMLADEPEHNGDIYSETQRNVIVTDEQKESAAENVGKHK